MGLPLPFSLFAIGYSLFAQLHAVALRPASAPRIIRSIAARGAGFANTVWMFQFGVQVALGSIFMLLGHVSLRGLLLARPQDDERDLPAAASP